MKAIFQINTKGQKVVKAVGQDTAEAVALLYKGLQMQDKLGRNWLRLSKNQPVFIDGMQTTAFAAVRPIRAKMWTMSEALEQVEFLLSNQAK